jgi:hypothetical protein
MASQPHSLTSPAPSASQERSQLQYPAYQHRLTFHPQLHLLQPLNLAHAHSHRLRRQHLLLLLSLAAPPLTLQQRPCFRLAALL